MKQRKSKILLDDKIKYTYIAVVVRDRINTWKKRNLF